MTKNLLKINKFGANELLGMWKHRDEHDANKKSNMDTAMAKRRTSIRRKESLLPANAGAVTQKPIDKLNTIKEDNVNETKRKQPTSQTSQSQLAKPIASKPVDHLKVSPVEQTQRAAVHSPSQAQASGDAVKPSLFSSVVAAAAAVVGSKFGSRSSPKPSKIEVKEASPASTVTSTAGADARNANGAEALTVSSPIATELTVITSTSPPQVPGTPRLDTMNSGDQLTRETTFTRHNNTKITFRPVQMNRIYPETTKKSNLVIEASDESSDQQLRRPDSAAQPHFQGYLKQEVFPIFTSNTLPLPHAPAQHPMFGNAIDDDNESVAGSTSASLSSVFNTRSSPDGDEFKDKQINL